MSAINYITVEGPAELKQALSDLLEKLKADHKFATQVHYILYRLANQQSLIRVDLFFHISYYDLLGRSATIGVKEVIGQFLRDKCGDQGRFEDVSGKEMLARNITSFLKTDGEHGRVVLSAEAATLTHAWQQLERAAVVAQRTQESVTKAREHFGLFHQTEAEQSQALVVDGVRIKSGQSHIK